jgi:RAB protein geranylgeranyltransferase component A
MAWLAVDKDGKEGIYTIKPIRGTNILNNKETWLLPRLSALHIILPKGSIKRLIGKDLTWYDKPVRI